MSGFAPAIVVPVYDHEQAVGATVTALRPWGLPTILVDDGSGPRCAAVLDRLAADHAGWLQLLRLPRNGGKGAAVTAGLRAAAERDRSHALQIDADGQHDAADIPRFLAAAERQPEAVINGCPVFDESVPKARLYGRYATHLWVWINTLSGSAIGDSLCGFRVYPLRATLALLDRVAIGQRMDFDIDIIVRLYWSGLTVVNLPTRVGYACDGVSHFHLWRDNLLISRTHAKLFFGMLVRIPALWRRRRAEAAR